MRSVLAAVLVAMLAGCVGGGTSVTLPLPDTVARTTENNGRFISLVGPERRHGERFLGVPRTNFFTLRSSIDAQSGETLHQLYVEDSYFGTEREFNAAQDAQGRPLKFIPISKNEITCSPGCSYAEEFAAELPEAMLRGNPQGFAVTFTAKSGDKLTIEVPAELIQKQLAALDAARAGERTAAAAPPQANEPNP